MKEKNDYKNDYVSKFCALLVDACIFAPHIVTKFLSTIYVENKNLRKMQIVIFETCIILMQKICFSS